MRVAQLDRASGYGPEGRGFESSRAREENKSIRILPGYSYFVLVLSDSKGSKSRKADAFLGRC